jgi:radical SAM protein with 4Fe4S-binding SPASM domain
VRLHLLEVDHDSVRDSLALSARENIQALLAFAELQENLAGMHLDLFEEMERLLSGQDSGVGCTWRACDPYTTEAVQGVEGNGQSSNCGRTNKEGIGFTKAAEAGYERYLALYRTPQSDNGCAGCRFFLMCKGQCPGTSVDGDWRNRTEHCEEWKHLFRLIERRMILAGKIPLTIQPVRFELEKYQILAWEKGENPSISRSLAEYRKQQACAGDTASAGSPKPKARVSWVGEIAREKWQRRLERLPEAIEEITVHTAHANDERCAVRLVPASSFHRLLKLAEEQGMAAAILPAEALPRGICTRPAEAMTGVFLAGAPGAVANAQVAWANRDLPAFHALLNLPVCCARHSPDWNSSPGLPDAAYSAEGIPVHPLLSPLGISALAVEPCRLDCPSALEAAAQWLDLAAAHGYAVEAGWLRECFSWAISWSELHGVTEVKTPLFKMCFQTGSNPRARLIRRAGTSDAVEGSIAGLTFPYAAPVHHARLVEIGGLI